MSLQLAPEVPESQNGMIAAVTTAIFVMPSGVAAPSAGSDEAATAGAGEGGHLLERTTAWLVTRTGRSREEFSYLGGVATLARISGTVMHRSPRGDGYALRVLPGAGGARLLVRTLVRGLPSAPVVEVPLRGADDVAFVPLTIEAESCILSVQAAVFQCPDADGVAARMNDAVAAAWHRASVEASRRYAGRTDRMGETMDVRY